MSERYFIFRVRSDSVLPEDQDVKTSAVQEGEHEVSSGDPVGLHEDGCEWRWFFDQERNVGSGRVHTRRGKSKRLYTMFRKCPLEKGTHGLKDVNKERNFVLDLVTYIFHRSSANQTLWSGYF